MKPTPGSLRAAVQGARGALPWLGLVAVSAGSAGALTSTMVGGAVVAGGPTIAGAPAPTEAIVSGRPG